jgi:thiamine biosynthesis lipoprotein
MTELGAPVGRGIAVGAVVALVVIAVLRALDEGGAEGATRDGTTEADAASVRVERYLMGTRWSIEVRVPEERQAAAFDAIGDAFDEVARVEAVMSEWRPDSPISRVNAGAGQGQPVAAPEELVAIVARGIAIGRATDGAFDITWRGLGDLWRFDGEGQMPPATDAVAAALVRVGYERVRIAVGGIELPDAGMALGLGGIAKGYGIDRAGAVLRQAGYRDFYVDGGGDVLASASDAERPWRVGIRDPRGGASELIGTVVLRDGAVVTSGDYERFVEVDGVRYHHIIDARTGWPARGCQSVTVVAPTAERADALATALFVMGPEAAERFVAETGDVEALVVDAEGTVHRFTPSGRESVFELR